MIVIRQIDEKHLLYLVPKITDKKIKKILDKNKNRVIIFSEELNKYNEYLKNCNKDIGIEYFIEDILKYIMEKTDKELTKQNIHILTNNYNSDNLKIINNLLHKVKTLNIVSENTKRYMQLEEKIYSEKRKTNNSFK